MIFSCSINGNQLITIRDQSLNSLFVQWSQLFDDGRLFNQWREIHSCERRTMEWDSAWQWSVLMWIFFINNRSQIDVSRERKKTNQILVNLLHFSSNSFSLTQLKRFLHQWHKSTKEIFLHIIHFFSQLLVLLIHWKDFLRKSINIRMIPYWKIFSSHSMINLPWNPLRFLHTWDKFLNNILLQSIHFSSPFSLLK